jgi:plasmid stabilization system protein ParE
MDVVFSDRARLRLHQIGSYIAADNPVAAERVLMRIRQTVELLAAALATGPKLGYIRHP